MSGLDPTQRARSFPFFRKCPRNLGRGSAASLTAEGVDLVVPSHKRRRRRFKGSWLAWRIWISTMIQQECIYETGRPPPGSGAHVRRDHLRARNERRAGISRRRCANDVALLKGLAEERPSPEVLATRITMMPGGRGRLLRRLNGPPAPYAALVSGRVSTPSPPPWRARLGFDEHRSQHAAAGGDGRSRAGTLTGRVAEPILGREAKVAGAEKT